MLELGKLGGSPPSTICSTVLAHKDGLEARSQWVFLPGVSPSKAPQAPSLTQTQAQGLSHPDPPPWAPARSCAAARCTESACCWGSEHWRAR